MTKALLTDEQKAWRRHQRRAEATNAKARAEAGMFADVPGEVPTVTADDMWRRWRMNKAMAAENVASVIGQAADGLLWVKLQAIERWAIELLGERLAAELIEHVRKVYPMPSYGPSVWANLLSGNYEVVYRYRLEFRPEHVNQYNSDGRRLVVEAKFPPADWRAPITREEFWERFPYKEPALGPEPDDGGLFERTIACLGRKVA